MPIYEFECGSCGARFEGIVAAGTVAARCPECGSEGAERKLSSFAPTSGQLTPAQKRRLEDRRGIDRDGARTRFKRDLARRRDRAGRGRGGGASG